MDEYILKLSSVRREMAGAVGSKAALLGELSSHGFPVPQGFCITTLAHEEFLRISGIEARVTSFRGLTTGDERQQSADDIAVAIEEAAIQPDLAVALSTTYRSLGARPRVAVRPSIAYPDTLKSPVTGKLERSLGIIGEKDLYQAIRNLWAGIWDPVVLSLCERRGLDHAELKPAVLVQSMVRPISSGTVLTADPVTGENDKLLITAGWGMKQESISGQVMPDTYHVDRETLTLRYKRIVTKELMVSASGLVPVPKNRKNAVVLKDVAIRDLCQMALGVESVLGSAAEVEWCALQGGALQVIATSPIEFEEDVDAPLAATTIKAAPTPVDRKPVTPELAAPDQEPATPLTSEPGVTVEPPAPEEQEALAGGDESSDPASPTRPLPAPTVGDTD
jgi:pyruvate,water dikinase